MAPTPVPEERDAKGSRGGEEVAATDDQLSQRVERDLRLHDVPESGSLEPKPPAASPRRQEESQQEVGELAGYLEELYLPRASVSADAALMADLMYT